MKILKKISVILTMIMIVSCISFASETDHIKYEANEQGYINIIIKGKENIKAYENAGLIKKCNIESTEDLRIPDTVKGTSIPTITYNLSRGGRSFSYSFSNYIYSNYIYSPAPDSNSSTGYGIYHYFLPKSTQKIGISYYFSNNQLDGNEQIYTIDDDTLIGRAVRVGHHYIKYRSSQNVLISGSATVY